MPDLEEQIVEYSRQNIAKVDIFLKDPYVKRFIREEKISEITFVGTVGGLLGLFIGFSFVSAVEMVYLLVLGLFGLRKSTPEKMENTKRSRLDQSINLYYSKPYSKNPMHAFQGKKTYPTRWHE